MDTTVRVLGAGCAIVVAFALLGAQNPRDARTTRVDAIFSEFNARTPGCTVGASVPGEQPLLRAYGVADLERNASLTPESIFEAGSVSKQFTAAAILLLARDGRLSLEDPVTNYIPELPDYGARLTIRHMLTHTSGLRDWGTVAAIAGRPRWTRIYTQSDVLEIASRQRALNFAPGTQFSYTNTGYNLAALIVARVSGMSFDAFTHARMFEPLGMTRTSWDTDHARLVRGRALGYAARPDGFATFLPFEDVYGNRGLLTTVGDLLKWSENFHSGKVGGAAFIAELQQPQRLADGRDHGYAFGLFTREHNGIRQIVHDGGTAGYRAALVRFPAQGVSVAVLCNTTSADAMAKANAVAEIWLTMPNSRSGKGPLPNMTPQQMSALAGVYKHEVTGRPMRIVAEKQTLHAKLGDAEIPLTPVSSTLFETPWGVTLTLDGRGTAIYSDERGVLFDRFVRVSGSGTDSAQPSEYLGRYASDEADVSMTVELEGGSLRLARRGSSAMPLVPEYPDAFSVPGLGTVIFRRDPQGRINAFSVVQDRVWDLRLHRQQ
jgi:CubicO group peptidase (beta-lactamase class C family)